MFRSELPGSADHPRACGANTFDESVMTTFTGSSPRMRGKLVDEVQESEHQRIIPAHAGQTWPAGSPAPTTSDHPRACGANELSERLKSGDSGSSPRMRGKLDEIALETVAAADHPRACGANLVAVERDAHGDGSSPRMRGKRFGVDGGEKPRRIIPAHAGQTQSRARSSGFRTDHPRACGANLVRHASISPYTGSSPRMRGKLGIIPRGRVLLRIIPAHAGQTISGVIQVYPSMDHPRACGANRAVPRTSVGRPGSSPRMRGKQSDFMRKLLSAGPSIIGFAQWLQSSYYCSCLQSSAKTPISRGTTPTSLFLGFQNSITLLLLT